MSVKQMSHPKSAFLRSVLSCLARVTALGSLLPPFEVENCIHLTSLCNKLFPIVF